MFVSMKIIMYTKGHIDRYIQSTGVDTVEGLVSYHKKTYRYVKYISVLNPMFGLFIWFSSYREDWYKSRYDFLRINYKPGLVSNHLFFIQGKYAYTTFIPFTFLTVVLLPILYFALDIGWVNIMNVPILMDIYASVILFADVNLQKPKKKEKKKSVFADLVQPQPTY